MHLHHAERLEALNYIIHTMNDGLEPRATLDAFLEQIVAQMEVDAAAILMNTPSGILIYAAGQGFRTELIGHSRLDVAEGLAGKAVVSRHLMGIPDVSKSSEVNGRARLIAHEGFKAYFAVPLIAKGQVMGVLEIFNRTSLNPDAEWMDFLETMAAQAAIAIQNIELFDNLQRAKLELEVAYGATLEGWVRALDMRDGETEGHTQRVTEITLRLATAMGVPDQRLEHITRGALLHDIGKLAIPDSILRKPGPLSEEEWELMRRHPIFAYELLLPISFLEPALEIPYCHHEKWDGSGYPRGLSGEQIPLSARIFAVADVWDALLSDRPYRPAWDEEAALGYIRSQAGKHFDPKVVEAFLKIIGASDPLQK